MTYARTPVTRTLMTMLGTGASVALLMSACSSVGSETISTGTETMSESVAEGTTDKSVGTATNENSEDTKENGLPVIMDAKTVGMREAIMGRFHVDKETRLVMASEMRKGTLGVTIERIDSLDAVWQGEGEMSNKEELSVKAGDYYVVAIGHNADSDGTVTVDFLSE